jgi:putative endonuclease
MQAGYVYIMASGRNGTIYIGATRDLIARVWQHRKGVADSFSKKHGCKMLVWYEQSDDLQAARQRELQMKKWKRQWKLSTIEAMNPDWCDLYPTLFEGSSQSLAGPLPSQGHR